MLNQLSGILSSRPQFTYNSRRKPHHALNRSDERLLRACGFKFYFNASRSSVLDPRQAPVAASRTILHLRAKEIRVIASISLPLVCAAMIILSAPWPFCLPVFRYDFEPADIEEIMEDLPGLYDLDPSA